jgi:hypothetical protein
MKLFCLLRLLYRFACTALCCGCAGEVKYLWPIQQAVSDLDTQKKRAKSIRESLGWSVIGCELIECYDDSVNSGLNLSKQFRLFGAKVDPD